MQVGQVPDLRAKSFQTLGETSIMHDFYGD